MDTEVFRQQGHSRVCEGTSKIINKFNKKRVPAIPYAVGDKYVIENRQLSNGPFKVTYCLPNDRYALKRIDSRGTKRVAAHEQLRTWTIFAEFL